MNLYCTNEKYLQKIRIEMNICDSCKKDFNEDELREYRSVMLCEDCYIDVIEPQKSKSHYNNDAEFMQRLKDNSALHPQQFH